MANKIEFGTDGWRAIIADQFTFDNVRACAQGLADYLKDSKTSDSGIVIGYDTRFASEDFAAVSAEVIAANDIRVWLCSKPTPTPVVSYSVVNTKSAGAIIITASHNPGKYNGFKVKDSLGASAPTELITKVEQYTNTALSTGKINRLPLEDGIKAGKITSYDAMAPYSKHLEKLIDLGQIRNARLSVMIDSMYGAGMGWYRELLQGGKLTINEIHGFRNPIFPVMNNPEPIAKNLVEFSDEIKKNKANVGFATDGDADRIGIMTEKGEFINQLQTFALLALYLIEIRNERRPIVRSICSSNMLDILGKMYQIPVYITKVGFKDVAPVMMEKDAAIGGEESGGYGFRGNVPDRDGLLAGIYFLDYMIKTGKTPSQLLEHLFSKVGPHYYYRYDFETNTEKQCAILENMETKVIDSIAGIKVKRLDRTDGFKYLLADDSWLLIRFSGTEPLIRIYSESHSTEEVKKILDAGVKIVGL